MNGDELKQRREALEMTQEQLANQLGVNVMTVSRWERGLRTIPPHLSLALEAIESKQKGKSSKKAKRQK